jgi:hypothetical protein
VEWERGGGKGLVITGQAVLNESPIRWAQSGERSGVLLPDIRLRGVTCVERWLAVDANAGKFRLEMPGEKPSEATAGQAPTDLAGVVRAGGRVWHLGREQGPVWLLETGQSRTRIQVAAREHVAAVLDQKQWSYQSTWWLFHDGPTTLSVKLPPQTRFTGLMVCRPDEASSPGPDRATPAGYQLLPTDDPEVVRLQLQGTGARRLSIRWFGKEVRGSLPPPSLELPRLEGDEGGTRVSLLVVPPGYRLASGGGAHASTIGATRAELTRAAGQQELVKLLLEVRSRQGLSQGEEAALESQLLACEQRASRHLWSAGYLLQRWATAGTNTRQSREVTDRLQELRDQERELLRRHGRELPRLDPEELPADADDSGDTPREGRLLYHVDPTPAWKQALLSEEGIQVRRSLTATGALVVFLLAVWVLASSATVVKVAHLFWPEQAVLLGLGGLQAFGPTWPVVFLLALGVMGRLLSLGGLLLSLLRRVRRPEPVQG